MGEVRVPATPSGRPRPSGPWRTSRSPAAASSAALIRALALIKGAAAGSTPSSAWCPADVADAIRGRRRGGRAAWYDADFPIDVFQTGSGTSLEHEHQRGARHPGARAARRAARVHPNDHVNASPVLQRRVPLRHPRRRHRGRRRRPDPGAGAPGRPRCERKASEFADGREVRPHPPDGRHPGHPGPGVRRVRRAGPATASSGCGPSLPRLGELPLGGTAVGTGINTPPGFAAAVIAELAATTGLPLTEARNHFEAQSARDGAGRDVRASCAPSPSA